MKTKYIYKLFIITILISCSTGEENEIINKKIKKWNHKSLYADGNINTSQEYILSDNKIINQKAEIFNVNGISLGTYERLFSYENEKLSKIIISQSSSNENIETKFYYNNENLLTKVITMINNIIYTKTTWEYDKNLVIIKYWKSTNNGIDYQLHPSQPEIQLIFDERDNLIESKTGKNGNYTKIINYSYNSSNNITQISNSNSTLNYTYSSIQNPIGAINTSTYGQKNFLLFRFPNHLLFESNPSSLAISAIYGNNIVEVEIENIVSSGKILKMNISRNGTLNNSFKLNEIHEFIYE